MKVAKFIYPMLLVALGLHGLALFVPIGGASEPTPEEVAVDDVKVPKGAADEAVPGPLPVPDPNVSTGTPKAAGEDTDNVAPPTFSAVRPALRVATRSSTPRSAAGRPVTISRRAPTNSQPSAPPSTPNSASLGSSANAPAAAAEIPVLSPSNTASDNRNRPSANNATANNVTSNVAAGNATANNSATRAIATISEALKKFRDDLSQEIAYNPEHTDLEGAADRRDQWLSSINQQASAATIETLEPTPALEIANLAYPINESKQPDRHSFKLCLDQPPHDAEVGILFDSQGNVARTPKIIRSTGYAALNNEILAAIAAYDNFPTERDSKAYTLIVKVEYSKDECVSLPKLMSSVPLL
ncbi:MAG: hypothetical protein DCF15_19155 [Phormidesmis priestleyi]|uniref:TonB C-terminal domain-containing protein n=1 Tax=Phormidesmis priestleyi TaxID=268141 RepID=A0A2W4YJF9_9CYAN|nr:MAG: hypothetical protein DCF15_19155 [Phormidesmis priestleyi]